MAQSLVMSFGVIFVTLLLVSMHACSATRDFPGLGIHAKEIKVEEKPILEREVMNNKVSERSERLIQESKSHETVKTSDEASLDEAIENSVVMDYVTPHRKSPIHNTHH